MLLPIAQRELIHRLTHERSFWLVNLPRDFEVIDCHVVKDRILFVIRSMSFPRVARGAPILEFQPEFNGRKWLPG